MTISREVALEKVKELIQLREAERDTLDEIRRYWVGRQGLPAVIPSDAPNEVREMARMSRVNICGIVVESLSQSLFVEGYRMPRQGENIGVWDVWQANRMDARQSGIHRAALAYGVAYAVVLPGKPAPVIRGLSPRRMTTQYGFDPDWPVFALERRGKRWRLYTSDQIWEFDSVLEASTVSAHSMGVTPVIRYLDAVDLDIDDEVGDERPWARSKLSAQAIAGQVVPLAPLQDQIDFTTFNLLVAQQYSAFRQRYIIGWTGTTENDRLKASASRFWVFEDEAETMRVGEFEQTDLDGYIKSREASLRHAATLSQTPVHELIGELVNLSAEALAAAEAGRDRKVADRQTLLGESHEQMLGLVGQLTGRDVPIDAEMLWRDTSARAFGAVVDGLGKLATMLQIPPEMLWEKIPGVTQAEIERWKQARADQPPAPPEPPAPAE